MATRRTTRRSLAANGNENDVTSQSLGASGFGGEKKPVVAAKKITMATKGGEVARTKFSATTTGLPTATRKRAAFTDVTNEPKAKATTSAAAGGSKAFNKVAVVAPKASASRTIRTRSSTGGVDEEEMRVKAEEDELKMEEDDAMVLDEPAPAPRVVKSLRRPAATNSTSKVPIQAPVAVRRPLASRSTNTTSNLARPTNASTAKVSSTRGVPTAAALRAKERREQAEKNARAAEKELEEARLEEQRELELTRAAKRQKTSPMTRDEEMDEEEMEDLEVDFEDEEDEEDESRWEVENRQVALERDFGWEDLDECDEDDPLMVSAYVVEIYEYLREVELTTMATPDYMSDQNEVTWKMRGILIDWLVEIHTKFRLLPETIFLATNIVDRFLSKGIVSLVKFQLVGITALFIASKYEEVVCPSVSNFLYMTDGGYADDEILKAERYVLSTIEFNLSYPNPINFLRRISKADGYCIEVRTMAKYLMEISVVDHKFMAVTPSLIAAAGAWLARKVLAKGPWHPNLVHYSGYTESELKATAQLMLDYVVRSSTVLDPSYHRATFNPLHTGPTTENGAKEIEHPNFTKKYTGKKFFKAAATMKKWAEEEFAPIRQLNPSTGKNEFRQVPALL